MRDDALLAHVVERVAAVAGVVAVTLGGSRAQGTHRPDSDWDFGVYYRGALDTDGLRAIGWTGQVFEPGDWGGGVFNGGAWLDIDGRRVDLIYRDLDNVEGRWAEAREGRFSRELLMFYLAGIPTYVVVGELALNRVLAGDLPRPDYPDALAARAAPWWHENALMTIDVGARPAAARGDRISATGLLAQAVLMEAHSRLAARKEWVLNEKGLAVRAGLAMLADAVSAGDLVGVDAARAAVD